jgi:5-methylcytosine-specific restriction endonuclease McrA
MGYIGDEKRAYNREWTAKRRAFYIVEMGGKCVECGSTEKLEVDHIDPATKLCNPTRLWSRTDEFIRAELAKCQLLCKSCHQKKTSAERIADRNLQHGDYGMYKWYKCRCQPCKDANAARVRRQRAAKKYE